MRPRDRGTRLLDHARAPGALAAVLEDLLAATTETVAVWDGTGRVVHLNGVAAQRVGEVEGHAVHLEALVDLDGRALLDGSAGDRLAATGSWRGTLPLADGRGGFRPTRATVVVQPGPTGLDDLYALIATDPAPALAPEGPAAGLDPLTGLVTHRGLVEHLGTIVPWSAGAWLTLVLLDLDGLVLVNDAHGHAAGDAVLVEVAHRLRESVRPGDLVARVGGDEFAVLVPAILDDRQAFELAERLRTVVEVPVVVADQRVAITASAGVGHDQGAEPLALLHRAGVALHQAKERGSASVALFDEQLRSQAADRLALHDALRTALADGELSLHWQPQVTLGAGKVLGFEALLRWTSATLGRVTPDVFIPAAEESGLILPIGRWVLEEACRQVAEWTRTIPGTEALTFHVNLSSRQLADPHLVPYVVEALASTGVATSRLCLEVTETAVVDDLEAASQALQRIRDAGVKVAIDDFGVGYSSLGYLRQLPVDVLKLDKSFVDRLGAGDPADAAIVVAVVNLARSLGLDVVAEGVETEEQRRELRALGCSQAQGYLFSRPLPVPEMTSLLEQRSC